MLFSEAVHRAPYSEFSTVEHMGIDHCGFQAAVAQQFLDGPDVVSDFEQVSGE